MSPLFKFAVFFSTICHHVLQTKENEELSFRHWLWVIGENVVGAFSKLAEGRAVPPARQNLG
jgi:hypothetical protein